MLKIVRFDKHCSCHLQGEYVMVGRFWKPYRIQQAVGGELDLMTLMVEREERTACWIIFNIRRGSSPKAAVVHIFTFFMISGFIRKEFSFHI
jgi:hypothetical protein